MGKAHAWVKRLKTADRTGTGERSFAHEALSSALVAAVALIAISMLLIASAFAQADQAFAEEEPTAAELDWTEADAAQQSADTPANVPSDTPSDASAVAPSDLPPDAAADTLPDAWPDTPSDPSPNAPSAPSNDTLSTMLFETSSYSLADTSSDTPSAALLQAQAENTLASVNGRNWMGKLPDNIPVSSICIPGTHDAATMWTKLPGGLSAVQDQPIGEWSYPYVNVFAEKSIKHFDGQLNSGVRYFDLRLSVKTADDTDNEEDVGKLYLLHGFHYNEAQLLTDDYALAPADYKTLFLDGDGEDCNGDGLEDGVWPWLEDFLSRNPTETLIVEFTDEYDGKKAEAYEFFREKALEAGSRIWKGKGVPTLGEARGRIILFANLGGSYGRDRFKLSDGRYWAFPVHWGSGSENYGVEKCGEYDDIELWGQNTYEGIYAKAKQNYVLNGIAYETEGGGLYARSAAIRDAAIKNGRHAWIVNFTSGNSPMKKGLRHMLITPRDYHTQTVKNGLMSVNWLKDDYLQGYWQNQSTTGVFTGILPMDFVNADVARFVYRINFYSYGPPEYTWHFTDDLDNKSKTTCTATRYVMGERSKSQTVESAGLHEFAYTKTPSCTEPGGIRYVAYFPAEAPWALPATTTQNVPALGHHFEYVSGNGTDTVGYKCSRCGETTSLTLNAKSIQYSATTAFWPLYDCTLGNVDAFNAAMGTNLYLNNVKLYKDGTEIQKAKDAGAYTARVYVDETHYVECAFEITPQVLDLPMSDYNKEYGEPDPDFKAELIMLAPDEVRDNISVTREPGENVGTYKLAASLSGNPNYTLKIRTSIQWDDGRKYPQLTINKRRITISKIPAQDKVYDGTTAATVKPEGAIFAYKNTGEEFKDPNLSFSVPCRFGHHNINENAEVRISSVDDLKLVGPNANNYVIENKYADIIDNGSATISKRRVKVWALAQSVDEGESIVDSGKDYAVTTGTGAKESGLAEGDELISVRFRADSPTGSTITEIMPYDAHIEHSSGEDATHNYQIEYCAGIAYVRNAVTGIPTATSFTYDGAEHELLTCNDPNVQYSLDGVSWSPDIPRSKDAGSWTVYWRIGESGETASLYTSIERRLVQFVPSNNVSKTYGDPDPTDIELHPWFNQLLPGHKLSGISRMPGENVGTYSYDVRSVKVFDGNNGNADVTSNYDITFIPWEAERFFTINPRPVTVSGITAETKVYDGTTEAVADTSTATLDGVLEFDRITVTASAQFADKAAGESKIVNLSDLALHGENVGNYVLADTAQQAWTTARIVPKPIGVSGIIVKNEGTKVYDGTNEIPLDVSGATFDKIGTDDLSVSPTGTLADPYVGNNKKVTIQLTGADKGNYEPIVTGPNTRYTAQVTPRPVSVAGITAQDKVYDGTTEAKLNLSKATLDGVLETDKTGVSLSEYDTTGEFESADVGGGKTVTLAPALEGEAAGNYVVASDTSQQATTASITKRPLAITANDQILDDGQEVLQGTEYVHVDALADSSGNPLPDQGLVHGQYVGGIALTADNAAGTVTPGQAKIYAEDDTADTPTDRSTNYDITYRSGEFRPSQFVTHPGGQFWVYDGTAHALVTPGKAVGGRKMQYYVELIDDIEVEAAGEGSGDSALGVAGGPGDEAATDEQQAAWMDAVTWQDSVPTAKDAGLYGIAYRAVDETGAALVAPDYDHTLAYIAPKTVSVTWSSTSLTYNGSPQAPKAEATGLVGNDSFDVTVAGAQTNVGTYTATATAPLHTNYELDTSSGTTTFTISPADISGADVALSPATATYTGEEICPEVTVTLGGHVLVNGIDYEVTYSDNVGVGIATATVEGRGNYTGSIRKTFTIKKVTSEVSINVRADIVGRDWSEADAFSFELVPAEGSEEAPLPLGAAEGTATEKAKEVSLGTIEFGKADIGKTYRYTVTETLPEDAAWDEARDAYVVDGLAYPAKMSRTVAITVAADARPQTQVTLAAQAEDAPPTQASDGVAATAAWEDEEGNIFTHVYEKPASPDDDDNDKPDDGKPDGTDSDKRTDDEKPDGSDGDEKPDGSEGDGSDDSDGDEKPDGSDNDKKPDDSEGGKTPDGSDGDGSEGGKTPDGSDDDGSDGNGSEGDEKPDGQKPDGSDTDDSDDDGSDTDGSDNSGLDGGDKPDGQKPGGSDGDGSDTDNKPDGTGADEKPGGSDGGSPDAHEKPAVSDAGIPDADGVKAGHSSDKSAAAARSSAAPPVIPNTGDPLANVAPLLLGLAMLGSLVAAAASALRRR